MILMNLFLTLVFSLDLPSYNVLDLPYYFATTPEAKLDLSHIDFTSKDLVVLNPVEEKELASLGVGLRLFVFENNKRQQAIERLSQLGLLQDGDIVLSFRPNWAKTVPYAHGQMGVSHAGLIYTKNGRTYNLDMPLNPTYVLNYDSELSSRHYKDLDNLHIVRPRGVNDEKRNNYLTWVNKILEKRPYNSANGPLTFNSDYNAPRWSLFEEVNGNGWDFITRLADIINGANSSKLSIYCSEFAFAMHALMSCRPEENIETCMNLPFHGPMPAFWPEAYGLAEGPIAILEQAGLSPEQAMAYILNGYLKDHTEGDPERAEFVKNIFSAGHSGIASNPLFHMGASLAVKYFYARLSGLESFEAKLPIEKDGSNVVKYTLESFSLAASQMLKDNYSPTAFLVNTLFDTDHPARSYDYVGTISFVSPDKYKQIQSDLLDNDY